MTETVRKPGERVASGLAGVLLMACISGLAACSGGEPGEQDRLYDSQRDALEKAGQVEKLLQDAHQRQLDAIDQQSQ